MLKSGERGRGRKITNIDVDKKRERKDYEKFKGRKRMMIYRKKRRI